jgi:hypothetical protein
VGKTSTADHLDSRGNPGSMPLFIEQLPNFDSEKHSLLVQENIEV